MTTLSQRDAVSHLSALKNDFGDALRDSLSAGLFWMAENQRIVSSPVPGAIPQPCELPSKDGIRTYTLAMIGELVEWMQELDWKPWKDKAEIDKAKIVEEFADVLAFQGILVVYMNALGIEANDLAEAYVQKSLKNIERFLGKHGIEYDRFKEGAA